MEILDSRIERFVHVAIRLLVLLTISVTAFGQSIDEYQVKGAFLFNFTKFVEWPNLGSGDTFSICVLGDDPFGSTLDQLVKGKTAYNRNIQIRRLKDPRDARQCQIVFVRHEEDNKASKLIEAVRGTQVLTVSERMKFAKMGGMLYLSMKDGRVSLGINPHAVEASGLKISAKLMTLAKNYKEEGEEP